MRAAVYREFGEVDKILNIESDTTVPTIEADEVLVKVEATSINPFDWKRAKGLFQLVSKKLPFIPLEDISGVVVQVGSNCQRLRVGDKVFGKTKGGGAAAEYCAISECLVAQKPYTLSHEEAGSIPLAGLTALQALKKGKIKTGQKVLILGGSGGVGSLAVQIGKAHGAYVAATCSTKNVQWVRDHLGADQVIDYTQQDWVQVLKGQEFDIVFDTVGGGWNDANMVAKSGSHFVTIVGDTKEQSKLTVPNRK
jgi:NADPH:quinone reductase-like Zn-dependent oxidoreductase